MQIFIHLKHLARISIYPLVVYLDSTLFVLIRLLAAGAAKHVKHIGPFFRSLSGHFVGDQISPKLKILFVP